MTARIAATLFCALALLAGVAQAAEPDPAAAKRLFDEARELHEAGQTRESLGKLKAAYEAFPADGILVSIANRHLDLGEPEEAAAALSRVVDAPRQLRKQMAQLTTAIEEQLAMPVKVRLTSSVAAARVSIDNGSERPTPARVQLRRGSHRFTFRAEGFEDMTMTQDLRGSREIVIEGALQPMKGSFKVKVEPPEPLRGIRILVDGKSVRLTPAEMEESATRDRDLKPGKYRVVCLRGIDETAETMLEVKANEPTLATCLFQSSGMSTKKILGWVSVAAAVGALAGGTVLVVSYLDDKERYPAPRYDLESTKPLGAGLLYATGVGLGVLSYFLLAD